MIPKIDKILYATDLSPNSKYAMRYAMNSAKNHNAKIIILHVLEQIQPTAQFLVHAYLDIEQVDKILEKNADRVKTEIENRMKKFCEKELKDEPELMDRIDSMEICEGFPAEEILRKADELACDIIVMGTHGKGFLENAFMGSTTRRVLRRVRKPVYIIPLPKEKTELTFSWSEEPDDVSAVPPPRESRCEGV
jgi:nucleotide-binding universal stress UspA family protein